MRFPDLWHACAIDDPRPQVDPDPILAPLALIAPAIALMVTLPFLLVYAAIAAILALVGAVAIGAPVLSLVRRLGVRGVIKMTTLGAVTAGAAVYLVRLGLGLFYRGGQVQLTSDVTLLSVVIGAATGATYATIYDSELAPTQVRWRIMIIVLVAVMLPWATVVWKGLAR